MTRLAGIRWLVIAGVLLGCQEASTARPSLITDERVLAVEIEPPEAHPGELARYTLLAVDPEGTIAAERARWSYCKSSKPVGDNRIVAQACAADAELPFAMRGRSVEAAVPDDACTRFGPEVEAGARPRDPDASGGYYQPVRVEVAGRAAVALHRIACALPNAPLRIAQQYRDRYQPNGNPEHPTLIALIDDEEVALDQLPADREVVLRAQVSATSAERFVLYDRATDALVERTESLQLSWHATAGELADDRVELSTSDTGLQAETSWQAPPDAGAVQLWVVLRDSRGGVRFASFALEVQ